MTSGAVEWPGRASAIAFARLLLKEPGTVVELRALRVGNVRTVSGYFDDPEKLVEAAASVDGRAEGVYVTLNPVSSSLLARANNRLVYGPRHTTSDSEVVVRRLLLIDFDPVRSSGISATSAEKAAALALCEEVAVFFSGLAWPAALRADSGNGYHLLFLIDVPAQDSGLVHRVLQALASRFDTDAVRIDQTVHNPARISKLYGTMARKGDSTQERPHRRSEVLEVPEPFVPVSRELLERLAGHAPVSPARGGRTGGSGRFDVEQYLTGHGLAIARSSPWQQGGHRWILAACPFNPEHTDRSAYVVQHPGGAIAAGCKHNSCSGKNWHDLRGVVEPGRQSRADRTSGGSGSPSAWNPPPGAGAGHPPDADDEIEIGDEISSIVQVHLQNRRVRALFEGRGKPELGPGGRALNTSSEGYDFSFALSLAKRGVRDPSDLATAIWHRPDEEARKKGREYVERTVRRALEYVVEVEGAARMQKREANFSVDRVRIFDSDRPIYEFTIAGVEMRLSSSELMSPSSFSVRFMDAHQQVPILPEDWRESVNMWLAQAERVALPEDASEECALRDAVGEAVGDLSQGEERADLDRGMALSLDGLGLVFKTAAIVRALREEFPKLQRNNLCRVLRELGYEFETPPIDGTRTRVWAKQDSSRNAREGAENK